jgi:hypothetical protein
LQPDPAIPESITSFFVSQGLLGILVMALVWYCLKLQGKLDAKDTAHKIELAAKDARILELQNQVISEIRFGYEFAKSQQTLLDAFLSSLRINKAAP